MTSPLPVTVLTGFLGAGKTTLLVKLLDESPGAGVAVVLNELGVAGTDGVVETSFLELTQGCVCCVRSDDLIRALGELRARPDVQRVVVETTGIADPLALTYVLERPDLAELCRLDAVVTVVDAAAWAHSPEWDMQVAAADLIVVSKLDLVPDPADLHAAIAELNPTARVLAGAPDPRVILDVERIAARPGTPAARHSGYTAVSYVSDAAHDAEAVEDLLESLPPAVYRAKGVVRTGAARWLSFHAVAGRVQVEPDAPTPAHGETRVVFIGRALDAAPLLARMAYTKIV